ncbi:MAG: methyltransferase domain-containing protein [Bacteroidetes bacterium]|nr:methyltransferase domain-containing protein [Bacteroidota bacterium]
MRSARAQRLLLVVLYAGMAVCARSPGAGAGWRTGFVLCALAAGVLVFVRWRQGGVSRREVLVMAIALRVIVFPLTPTLSDDGFRYVWDGMIQAEAGVNPYHYLPADAALAEFQQEAVYRRMNSSTYFSVYPPLSQLVFALGGLFYPLGWVFSWYLIKLVMVGGELLGLFLLSRMVRPRDLLLYAWHPLVVIETAGQAHTEALTIGLLLMVVWAAREARGALAGGALAAAGWVKLVPFVFAPFVIRRLGWKAAVGGVVVGVLLAAPYAASYTIPHVLESLDLYVRAFEFNAGPYFALKGAAAGLGLGDASKTLGPALQGLFLLSLPVLFAFDWKRKWPLEIVLLVILSLFFLCATTIHPWYLLPLLALLPLVMERETGRLFALGWFVLGVASMATYWVYAGPLWGYAAVSVGWTLFFGFMMMVLAKTSLPVLMRRRARRKWGRIKRHLPEPPDASSRVLDLGAGEGFVGEAIQQSTGAQVSLADVVDFNQTELPLALYDGKRLPFGDDAFELTVIVFVLHHTKDAEQVLREAMRVTDGRVVVLESVYESPWQHRLLARLDRLANRLRSGGKMAAQEEHLHFRTDAEWRAAFERLGLAIEHASIEGRWIHQQALYVLRPA